MKSSVAIGFVVGALVFAVTLTWIAQGNSFFIYKIFAPEYADVQRKVFENTAPFNQGMAQDMRRMQEEYIVADPDHKAAIGSLILHNFSNYDTTRLPPDLRDFYDQVKRDRGIASNLR